MEATMIEQLNLRAVVLLAIIAALGLATPASASIPSTPDAENATGIETGKDPDAIRYAQFGGYTGAGGWIVVGSKGYRGHNHHYRHGGYRRHGGWYGGYGPGWGSRGWGSRGWGGPNIGIVVEIPVYPRYRPVHRRVYAVGSTHVNWCANRFRSYRAWDNTFQPYHGRRRYCISPYR
jgi:hypothetical protein